MMVEIQLAELADAQGIAQVKVRGWRAAYRGIMPSELLDDLTVDAAVHQVHKAIASGNSEVLVAKAQGKDVLGFCWSGRTRDSDLPASVREVYAIYIDPKHLRQGIGRSLIDEASARARLRGEPSLALWVLRDNPQAHAFYAALGFAPDGAHRDETWGGHTLTEIRFRKPLDANSSSEAS